MAGRPALAVAEIAQREGLATRATSNKKGMLPNLRHEAFAQALARGANASVAYVEAGYNKNDGNAARLKSQEGIERRVWELKQVVQKMQNHSLRGVILTQDWIREQLIENVFIAKAQEKPDLAGANKALHLLGLDLGMFVERKEIGKPGDFDGLTIAGKRERVVLIAQQLGLDRIKSDAPAPSHD